MSTYQLSNDKLTIAVNSHGAELCKVTGAGGTEYLWHADPAYWKRFSPVLFPVVGNYTHKAYKYADQTWPMGQHGFARDTEFEFTAQTEHSLTFTLRSNEETRKLYPMDFILEITYTLEENQITVDWDVSNPGTADLHFSIGAHPAFNCPINGIGVQTDYTLDLHTDAPELTCGVLGSEGTLTDVSAVYPLTDGKLSLTDHIFDKDALIVEHTDISKMSLCLPDGTPYVTVDFQAPLFGIWSPVGKHAPFVCLEPWYGRSDRETFEGTVDQREYGTTLQPGESFHASYRMSFFPVK